MLRVADFGVRYGPCPVVTGISFALEKGEWLGLIGANGAGKSSLLKGLVGLLAHDGQREINGCAEADVELARSIAYLPQSPLLPPGMTVAEYVLLGRSSHLKWYASEGRRDRAAVVEALDRLELTSFADRQVTALSGGEAQRVSLARALAQEAPLLLLDEPTSSLDLGHQVGVLELVDELRLGHDLTVVAAMHDLTSAGRFADRLLLLGGGTALALGQPAEVLTEELLALAYGAEVSLLTAPDGSLVVVPDRRSPTAATTNQSRSSNDAGKTALDHAVLNGDHR